MFLNLIESRPNRLTMMKLNDPLWSGDTNRISSYGFGISVFYLAILFGFFISFFINNYSWQLAGLVVSTALFLAFTAASDHFTSKIVKYLFMIFAALMIAYLLLHAGIGSNRSVLACDQ
jgi:hypothetical protein